MSNLTRNPTWIRLYSSSDTILWKSIYHYLIEHDIQVRIIQQPDSIYTVFAKIHLEVPEHQYVEADFLLKSYLSHE